MEVLDKILDFFFFGDLQDLAVLLKRMEKYNITPEQLYDYIERKKKYLIEKDRQETDQYLREEKLFQEKAERCPYCDVLMSLKEADKDESYWECKKCLYSIYNPRSIIDELISIGIKDARVRTSTD